MKLTKKKGLIAIVLVAAIALMSFGFAAWTAELTIDGTATTNAEWEVVISDVTVEEGNESGASAADYSADDSATATLGTVTFTEPEGWVKYTVTVANNGTLPAKLTSDVLEFTENAGYTVSVAEFPEEDIIAADGTCVFEILVKADAVDEETNTFEIAAENEITLTLNYEHVSTVEEATDPAHTDHN